MAEAAANPAETGLSPSSLSGREASPNQPSHPSNREAFFNNTTVNLKRSQNLKLRRTVEC